MHNQQTVLILDQGGQSSRALVFNQQGDVLYQSRHAVGSSQPQAGYIEQNADEILQSLQHCLQDIAQQLPSRSLTICAAALIVQRSSLLAINRDSHTLLSDVISWQDTRNSDWLEQQDLDKQAIHKITGLYANSHYGASKMRWLLDHKPRVKQAADTQQLLFLPLASYLSSALTAADYRVDSDIASRTLLFDRTQRQWHYSLLQLFGIDQQMLPESCNDFYDITSAAQLPLGQHHIPLCLVAGDQSFLTRLLPEAQQYSSLLVNCGTGAFVQMPWHDDNQQPLPDKLLVSDIGTGSEQLFSVVEGTVNAAASALNRLWQQEKQSLDHKTLDLALLNLDDPPLYLSLSAGLGSPHWRAAQQDQLIADKPEQHQIAAKAVAVVESVIFLLMDNIALMREANPQLQQIIIGGGLANLDGLCQKLANISGLTLIRTNVIEASSHGAANFLFRAIGVQMRQSSSDDETHFSAQTDKELELRYQRFKVLIAQTGINNKT